MDSLGLVGLPNSGKSALFNALTLGDAVVAPRPFSTTETALGVAHVPDERLDALAEMSKSRKVVPASFEVVDIGAVRPSPEHGAALSSRFLAGVREADALALVLRAFVDDSVPGEPDPVQALAELELELVVADTATIEAQLQKKRKPLPSPQPLDAALSVAPQARKILEGGTPLYRSALSEDEREALGPLFLLTNKPALVVVNVGEDAVGAEAGVLDAVKAAAQGTSPVETLAVSVELEAEAMRLDPDERSELLEGLGLGEGALVRFARSAYEILGRDTFLTTGEKESRAWTFRRGARAPECAGVIHSDLERGFIKADVIFWKDLVELGSFQNARSKGKVRLEGKDYVVRDGDVLEIRFNV